MALGHPPLEGEGRRASPDARRGGVTVSAPGTARKERLSPHPAARFQREVPAENQVHTRGIEVGQIFYFGTKYSETMKANVAGADGAELPIHGGSYGVGVSRLVGAIIEACHDDAGIKWPEAVAPFTVAILNLKQGAADTDAACEQLYREFTAKGVDVLYDDTDGRAGAKFATADLIGIPWQVVVGPKGLAEGKVEIKRRSDGSRELVSPTEALARLTASPLPEGERSKPERSEGFG